MPRKSWLDLVWPVAGIDRSVSFQRQPPYSTPDALNVRTEDMSEYRERGGSRPGLGLGLRTQLPGPINLLTSVSVLRATWPTNYAPIYGGGMDERLPPTAWGNAPTFVSSPSSYQGLGSAIRATDGSFGVTWPSGFFSGRNDTNVYELSCFVRPAPGAVMEGQVKLHILMADADTDVGVNSVEAVIEFSPTGYVGVLKQYDESVRVALVTSGTKTDDLNFPGYMRVRVDVSGSGMNTIKLYWRRQLLATLTASEINGHQSALEVLDEDGTIEASKVSADYFWQPNIAKPYKDQRRDVLVAVANGSIYLEETSDTLKLSKASAVNPDVILTAADREQKLYIADYGAAVSGEESGVIAGAAYNTLQDMTKNFTSLGINNEYVVELISSDYSQNEKQIVELFNCDGGTYRLGFRGSFTAPIAQAATGAAVKSALEALATVDAVNVTAVGGAGSSPAGGPHQIEFDGTLAGQDLELLAYQADALTDSGGGVPAIEITSAQSGAGGDFVLGSYPVSSVAGNTITFNPAIAVASGFTAAIGSVTYQVVRAPKVYDPLHETVVIHSASRGYVPAGCRLVCLYRDRIVYAGSDLLPHVWYMSRQGDPYDWDYSQEDSGSAIYSQPSVAGNLADPITALIAHGDECLIIGCYNSLWIVRGDPGYGGTVDQLSRKIGIVGSHAWCRTPDDMCVFLTPDGLYVMPAGCHGFPTSLSRERLPDDLLGIAPEREHVTMEYDTLHRGIHIFITRYDGTPNTHWWFDWEAKSFWRVKLQGDHEPFCLHERVAWDDVPVVLLAGRDGYMRYFDRDFQRDDQDHAIESYCYLGPFHMDRQGYFEGILNSLTATLGDESGPVNWELYVADSPERAFRAAARESGTWSRGGMNYRVRPRARGVAGILKVSNGSNNKRWFLERITAAFRSAGQRRVR